MAVSVTDRLVSEDLCEARRAETDRRLGNIESGVGKLIRAWFEGNGTPSMSNRLTTLEGDLANMMKSDEERRGEEKALATQRAQTRLALITSLISGIVAVLGIVSRVIWR